MNKRNFLNKTLGVLNKKVGQDVFCAPLDQTQVSRDEDVLISFVLRIMSALV